MSQRKIDIFWKKRCCDVYWIARGATHSRITQKISKESIRITRIEKNHENQKESKRIMRIEKNQKESRESRKIKKNHKN